MPFAIFLVSLLVSSSMFVSSARVSQDALVNQTLINSTAAFYTASSSSEVTWSTTKGEDSTKAVASLTSFRTDQEGSPTTRDLFSGATSADGGSMAMNQAVDTDSISTQVKLDTKSFVDQQNLSSAEIFLFEVPIDKAINDIQLDYCDKKKDTSDEGQCPELIIEWFKFRADGQTNFLSLDELKKSPSPKDPLSTCLKIESTNTERCVVMTSEGSTNDIDIKNSISDDTYHRRVTLKTYLPGIQHPGYHYLFRFRTKDRKNVHFSIYGLRTTGGGTKKKAPLPTAYFESDEVGKTQASFRRIRQQQAVSGGLQDGLEYVHYAHEVGGKNFFKE